MAKLGFAGRIRELMIRAGYHSSPAFLIIGAQKAGTTALYYYLSEHPRIVPSREKEVGFFVPELVADWPEHHNHGILCTPEGTVFDDRRAYRRAAAWYHAQFPLPHELGRGRLTFEATPDYLYFPRVAERIFRYDSKMKLIVLLRNPVERAFSAWNMYRSFGGYRPLVYAPKRETREFDVAVRDEIDGIRAGETASLPGYVARGLYYDQLLRFFEWFGCRQVLVIDSDDLAISTSSVVDQVFGFLGLPGYTHHGEWDRVLAGGYKPGIPDSTARLLREFYRPFNSKLYRLLDRDFRW